MEEASVAKIRDGWGRIVQVEEGRTAETRTAEAAVDMRGEADSDAALFRALVWHATGVDTLAGEPENHAGVVDEAGRNVRRVP
jgi:hypothetical protein